MYDSSYSCCDEQDTSQPLPPSFLLIRLHILERKPTRPLIRPCPLTYSPRRAAKQHTPQAHSCQETIAYKAEDKGCLTCLHVLRVRVECRHGMEEGCYGECRGSVWRFGVRGIGVLDCRGLA